jgi:hypothetical protein
MYPGDGYISRSRRTYRLEVSLRQRQKAVIERVAGAIAALRTGRDADDGMQSSGDGSSPRPNPVISCDLCCLSS